MKKNLVIAPHADDETLGCGGTILKLKKEKEEVHCVILTNYNKNKDNKNYKRRYKELSTIKKSYKFNSINIGEFTANTLESQNKSEIILYLKKIIEKIKPDRIFVPYYNDAHSDHRLIYDCSSPFFKSFRYPFIKEVYIYETISETNFNYKKKSFKPNTWININKYLLSKIKIMKIYKSEIKKHPFPRSEDAIKSLAILRGTEANFKYAEAFLNIKKIID
jgi:N-acetylglucosamine malate deacetylase 1